MIATVFRLATHPRWVAEHASLYGALGRTEAALAARGLVGRAVWAFVALGCAVVALNLAGMAALIWLSGATPAAGGVPVALWAMPAVPAVAAIVSWALARRRMPPWFGQLRAQMQADWQAVKGELEADADAAQAEAEVVAEQVRLAEVAARADAAERVARAAAAADASRPAAAAAGMAGAHAALHAAHPAAGPAAAGGRFDADADFDDDHDDGDDGPQGPASGTGGGHVVH